jgi:hypothetical protein
LRSTFQLDYDKWKVDGKIVGESKIISLDAGSQLNKIETVYSFKGTEMPVAIGIVKRKDPGTLLLNERAGIMGYWEPQHGKDGTLGIGAVIPGKIKNMKVEDQHLLTIINATSNKPFVYYTGAAWDKAGQITASNKWFSYLRNFKRKLQNPLLISW